LNKNTGFIFFREKDPKTISLSGEDPRLLFKTSRGFFIKGQGRDAVFKEKKQGPYYKITQIWIGDEFSPKGFLACEADMRA
jgi:hypothetical protein